MSSSDPNSPPPRTGPKVFISYRRDADRGFAHSLRRDLQKAFGDKSVFRDIEDIAPGDLFRRRIEEAVAWCNTFLALISPGWVGTIGRLESTEDFVRLEVAAALRGGVRVIPVLLNGAEMPKREDLPAELGELTQRQARKLDDDGWDDDVRRLIEGIRAPFVEPTPEPKPTFAHRLSDAARSFFRSGTGVAALAALLLLVSAAFYFAVNGGPGDFEGCLRSRFPDVPRDRFATAEEGSYNLPVIRQDQPKEGAFVVRLTEGGRPAGALSISLYPANDLFKVGGVVEPPCRDVETYLNDDKKGADKHNLQNWDRLRLTLAGREYILRLGHQENTIFVTFNKAASFPSP